jgi:hypothetical protein
MSGARRRRKLRRCEKNNFYKGNVRCWLCGYPIPRDIVNMSHPLFGTIDHIIPKSKGGTDCRDNRAPSHFLCNQIHADKPVDQVLKDTCRHLIKDYIAKLKPKKKTKLLCLFSRIESEAVSQLGEDPSESL